MYLRQTTKKIIR